MRASDCLAKTTLGFVFALVLGACAPSNVVRINSDIPPARPVPDGFLQFTQLCYETAPSFDRFASRARSMGMKKTQNGWFVSADGAFQAVVQSHPDHDACQFSFGTTDPKSTFVAYMDEPFNATKLSSDEVDAWFGNNLAVVTVGDMYVSRTTFGGAKGLFQAIDMSSPRLPRDYSLYGLLLQISK